MNSIRTRLLASITLIVVISGLAISLTIIHHYRTSLQENAVHQAKNTAQNLALTAADMVLINDTVSLQRLLNDRIQNDEAVAYLFVIHNDDILAHTFPEGVPVQLARMGAIENPAAGGLRKVKSQEGKHYLDVSWPISGGRAGILRLGYSEEPLEKRVVRLWLQAGILTFLFLFIALVMGMLLVRQITRPLLLLTDVVGRVDESHLETTVQIHGDDEAGRLATAFNNMLTRLKTAVEQLEKNKKALENKNLEIERAHRQTRSFFEITRGLGALAGLKDICTFLVERLGGIISCKTIAILLYPVQGGILILFYGGTIRIADEEDHALQDDFAHFNDSYRFYPPSEIKPEIEALKETSRVAVFPFSHENRLIGVLLAGCTTECECLEADLKVIRMVIDQSSGAIHRALVQESEMTHLRERIEKGSGYAGFVGKDPQMQLIYKLIEDVAPSEATVLIEGESGTGKEMAARALHEKSFRKNMPLVVINCSAYPATLLESELFGHEKGAFTGAVKQKSGRFEQADGGTVFLDEIADIPLTAQVKLLRVLQNRKLERIGGEETISVDIRILAATNKGLLNEVKEGRFREDLYYRLNVIPMHLPPLRKRKNDIPYLARHFLRRFCDLQGKTIADFDSEAMRRMLEYNWPGNVRELENTVEHAVVLARSDVIQLSDFPASLGGETFVAEKDNRPDMTLEANEKSLLIEILTECAWNKTEAARRLGIGRSTLYTKLKRYRISHPTN